MSLYQLYKQQKISKLKKIYEYHNPSNFIIKAKFLLMLKILININCININIIK